MKKLLWLLLPALAAYGAWDLVREVRGAWTSDYSRTYSRAVGQTMSRAFDSLNLSGRGVRIGVLDAGFGGFRTDRWMRGLHVAAWRDFTGGDETAFFDDATDHGTRVCTNLGGRSGDTIRGLAWGAEYYLAKTDRAEVEPRAEERQLIRGIEWLLAHDVDVISSSLGYTTFDDFSGYTPAMLDGCTSTLSRYLDSLLTARPGLVFVQSAGNEGDKAWRNVSFPADVRQVITVGSCDSDGVSRSRSSGVGREDAGYVKPDFVAGASSLGTSFSTPVIAGLCACLLEYRPMERGELIGLLHASGTRAAAPGCELGYGIPQTDVLLRMLRTP